MATQKTDSETQTQRNPFMPEQLWNDLGFNAWNDKLREMSEAQSRTVKQMTDQVMGYGRQMSDYVGAQMQAMNKLAKDGIDYNSRVVEAWTKIGFDATQNVINNLTPRSN